MSEGPTKSELPKHMFSKFCVLGDPKDWSPVAILEDPDQDKNFELLERAESTLFNVLMGERKLVDKVMDAIKSSNQLPAWLKESLENEKPLVY